MRLKTQRNVLSLPAILQPLARIQIIALLAILALVLASCGGTQGGTGTDEAPGTGADTEETAGTGTLDATTTVPDATNLPLATTAPQATAQGRAGGATSAQENITALSEIVNNPDTYIGQTVTTRGEVSELLSASIFWLNDPAVQGGNRVLVVMRTEASAATGGMVAVEGDTVDVTGMVERFDPTTIENEAGITLEENTFADLTNATVIIADTANVMTTP